LAEANKKPAAEFVWPTSRVGRVIPILWYRDVGQAVSWLTKAFGFRERLRRVRADGTVTTAMVEIGDGLIFLSDQGDHPEDIYRNPNQSGVISEIIRVNVANVGEHFDRARAADAKILSEPEDKVYGDRSYRVADLEGHHWEFAEHVREVDPTDWGAVVS
jgi:uncharacterized glyoxalase superfamily protein PhnB